MLYPYYSYTLFTSFSHILLTLFFYILSPSSSHHLFFFTSFSIALLSFFPQISSIFLPHTYPIIVLLFSNFTSVSISHLCLFLESFYFLTHFISFLFFHNLTFTNIYSFSFYISLFSNTLVFNTYLPSERICFSFYPFYVLSFIVFLYFEF